jgi:hypothetical protein
VQLVKYKEHVLNSGPLLLIWDNCPPHVAKMVLNYLKNVLGIDVLLLPKNMTDLLQVIDLVTNAPLKADQRRQRILFIFQTTMETIYYKDTYIVSIH